MKNDNDGVIGKVQLTDWENPTDDVIKFDLYIGNRNVYDAEGRVIGKRSSSWFHVEIPPGETIQIASEYDHAIQKLDEVGVVVGGLAPQLVNAKKPAKVEAALLGGSSMIVPEKEKPQTIFVQKAK